MAHAHIHEPHLPPAVEARVNPAVPTATPNRWVGLFALSLAVFVVIMTSTSVNLALPAISSAFGISVSNLTWVIDAYTLALGALTLPGGTLGDIFGRRRVFLTGLGVFCAGTLCASVAPNIGLLVAARVLMGVGAAMVMPGTLSLISAMFVGRERATAIGLWGGMNGIALAVGPLIGGVLVEYVDWRAIFWTNLPLVAITFFLVPRYVPIVAPRPGSHRIDLAGAFTISGALIALIVGLIEGPSAGWTSPAILGCFVAAIVLTGLFVLAESRVAKPMVPLALFRSRTFCAANLSAIVLMLGVLSAFFFLSLFLQDSLRYSAVDTGLAYLPMAVFLVALAPLAGRLSARFGPRLPIVSGLLASAIGVFWMSQIHGQEGYSSLVGGLMLVGLGLGLASPAISNAAVSSVSPAMAGVAAGANAMARQVGGSIGIALLTAIFSGRFADHLTRTVASSGLPAPVRRQVLTGAAETLNGVAVPSGPSDAIVHPIFRQAFALGMGDTLSIFAVIAAVGVVVSLLIRRSDFAAARVAGPALIGTAATAIPAGRSL